MRACGLCVRVGQSLIHFFALPSCEVLDRNLAGGGEAGEKGATLPSSQHLGECLNVLVAQHPHSLLFSPSLASWPALFSFPWDTTENGSFVSICVIRCNVRDAFVS